MASAIFISLCPVTRAPAQPLATVHPSYDLVDIRPPAFQPQVTGMQLLPDGRLLVLTHEPVFNKPVVPGNLYVVDGVGGKSSTGVTFKKVASNVYCGTGLLAQDGGIFITEKMRLTEILGLDQGEIVLDTAINEVPGKYRTIYRYGWDNNYHQFAFGPLYRVEADGKGYFYVGLSTGITVDVNKSKNRASLIKISKETGTAEIVLSGIRTPNGLSFGPGGEIFETDNQGEWLPSSKLNNLRPGRFYGFPNAAGGQFDKVAPSPPAIWMPHEIVSASPADPTYLLEGPYAGQFLIGDVRFGGLQRCFLEKVNGEYQGAIFKFSGGLETAINHIVIGPDGVIYLGGMGAQASPFWTWAGAKGPKYFGLNKLQPNHKPTFDFLAVRSMGPDKIELQFTEPIDASAATPANYDVKTWTYQPTAAYGGPPIGTAIRSVTSAILTAGGDGVTLGVSGLKTGDVVYVKVKSIVSKSGRPLWTNEAWYTLNQFGPGERPTNTQVAGKEQGKTLGSDRFQVTGWDADGLRINVGFQRDWELELKDAFGRTLRKFHGSSPESHLDLPETAYPAGMYWAILKTSSGQYPKRIVRY